MFKHYLFSKGFLSMNILYEVIVLFKLGNPHLLKGDLIYIDLCGLFLGIWHPLHVVSIPAFNYSRPLLAQCWTQLYVYTLVWYTMSNRFKLNNVFVSVFSLYCEDNTILTFHYLKVMCIWALYFSYRSTKYTIHMIDLMVAYNPHIHNL